MAYKIYLCGGMTGLSEEEQRDWRISAKNEILQYIKADEIVFFDPTEFFAGTNQEVEEISMKFDLRHLLESKLIICNISANPFSVGTNMELGIAHNTGIPIVIYNPGNVELHPWQKTVADFEVDSLERLAEVVNDFYLPR